MSKLTSKQRNNLPPAEFAGPGRSYPINDRAHAANAKARATQQVAAGNLSPSAAAAIKARANKKLAATGHSFASVAPGTAKRDHYTPRG